MSDFASAWKQFEEETADLGIKNLLLYQDGSILGELHYDEDCIRNAYSATKSYTATAAGIAQAEGILSLDERVVDCFANELPDSVSPQLEALTLEHCLGMTLGQEKPWLMGSTRPVMETPDWVPFVLAQDFAHMPGEVFQYTNVGIYLVGVLIARRTGAPLTDYWYEKIFRPQGFFYPSCEVDPLKNTFGAGGLMVTTQHLLSLGRSYLEHDGIVPDAWIDFVHKPSSTMAKLREGNSYGYSSGFWLHAAQPVEELTDASQCNAFLADGKYGQYAVVMDDAKAVLAVTADCPTPYKILGSFWTHVYPEL